MRSRSADRARMPTEQQYRTPLAGRVMRSMIPRSASFDREVEPGTGDQSQDGGEVAQTIDYRGPEDRAERPLLNRSQQKRRGVGNRIPAVIEVRHVCHSPASQRLSVGPQPGISAFLTSQLNHVGDQAFLVCTPLKQSLLREPMFAQNAVTATRRSLHLAANVVDAGPAVRGAQKFLFAALNRINLSGVRSETARRRRSFCFCSRFSSLKRFVPIPPYFSSSGNMFALPHPSDGSNQSGHALSRRSFDLP
ncbi:hypothetical protein PhaeoP18_03821 (plasmid) [Phaeobacter piscinae]|uniref:Uncharacterized protein n=1 Tax=Phaeobacter piscinae TaxID=1580596 RepID=A0AAN1GUZ4_9RHOB|nr:hypothetical protein PhaeoP13_03593 [Phaeobacter piscinae]AUR38037.1 hypothetical protein PhaeoP18_03821 [Phaeobacter piscinae]